MRNRLFSIPGERKSAHLELVFSLSARQETRAVAARPPQAGWRVAFANIIPLLALLLVAGCQSGNNHSAGASAPQTNPPEAAAAKPSAAASPATAPAPATTPTPAAIPAPPAAPVAAAPVRIKAGLFSPITDSDGNSWLPDQGFADGETVERPDLPISNTKSPKIYQAERYSMTAFSYPLPNGKYVVKLHFAETFEGITGPGERVFSFNVQGQGFKDFDVWAKTGGAQRAYIETVNVEVTDGKLHISFTPQVENPEINGIEILPQ